MLYYKCNRPIEGTDSLVSIVVVVKSEALIDWVVSVIYSTTKEGICQY
jgi:hypothetical protein